MSNVIPFNYQGEPVRFNSGGWLHASKIAERFGKRLDRWLENASTLEYIQALDEIITGRESKILDTRKSGYVKTSRARADRGGGTWLHPKLAMSFARWCDAKFSVWCDFRIEALLYGELSEKLQFDQACKALANQDKRGSSAGRELAKHRWCRPLLAADVEYRRGQLQMVLELEVA